MGRPQEERRERDADTKILFKNTIITHSRSCSGTIITKSSVLHNIVNNMKTAHKYYNEGGKIKRDLSIETDICVLRRYYRIKRNKMSRQTTSLVDTEVGTIEEYASTSAYGDSDVKNNPTIDVETLMIENLKVLLYEWIEKHLMYNKNTQQKLDTVLDYIIRKLDSKHMPVISSNTTYVLEKEAQIHKVKDKQNTNTLISCKPYEYKSHCSIIRATESNNPRSTSFTVQNFYKDIRIISTLSMPRGLHNRVLGRKQFKNMSPYKMKKIHRRKLYFANEKSNILRNDSKFDLLAISTKSLTKRCVNYNFNMKQKRKHIVFLPVSTYKSANEQSKTTVESNYEINRELYGMPSLIKSLYSNEPDIRIKTDVFTMTENIRTATIEPNLFYSTVKSNDSSDKSLQILDSDRTYQCEPSVKGQYNKFNSDSKITYSRTVQTKSRKSKGKIRKRRRICSKILGFKTNLQRINNERYTPIYKKENSYQGQEILKYYNNVMQYFTDTDTNRNIKVDVRINVFPMGERETKDVPTNISNPTSDTNEVKRSSTSIYNTQPNVIEKQLYPQSIEGQSLYHQPIKIDSELHLQTTVCGMLPESTTSNIIGSPETIPVINGAVSQANYISNEAHIKNKSSTNKSKILQEINELRAIVKNLAYTAERLVSEQTKSYAYDHNSLANNDNCTSSSEMLINLRNPSKATQVSANFDKSKIQTNTKIFKDVKQEDAFDFINRLTKKSTSYRIIDSESLLKITDMTSKANEFNEFSRQFADQALTCSFPKSRSLYELTTDRNKKLVAFFCGNDLKPKYYHKTRNMNHRAPNPSRSSKISSKTKNKYYLPKKAYESKEVEYRQDNDTISYVVPMVPENDGGYSSTLTGFSIISGRGDDDSEEHTKPRKQCKTKLLWYFYYVILSIFIFIIIWLLYAYVLRDLLNEKNDGTSLDGNPHSSLHINLSELGF